MTDLALREAEPAAEGQGRMTYRHLILLTLTVTALFAAAALAADEAETVADALRVLFS